MKGKLLIVDDDPNLRRLVLSYGENEGYECVEAENGHRAIGLMNESAFDLVVLDVLMPVLDGFETLREIRTFSQVPVILLTARSEEYDKLLGFELGADDYIPKPFSPRELMARIRAVQKRSGHSLPDIMDCGDFRISVKARVVELGDTEVTLPPKEFDLLLHLARNAGLVLRREQILDAVWGYNYYGDVRTIDTHIKSLREHLGEYRDAVQTVWGVGYKFSS